MLNRQANLVQGIFSQMSASGLDVSPFIGSGLTLPRVGDFSNFTYRDTGIDLWRSVHTTLAPYLEPATLPRKGVEIWSACVAGYLETEDRQYLVDKILAAVMYQHWQVSLFEHVVKSCTSDQYHAKWLQNYLHENNFLQYALIQRWCHIAPTKTIAQIRITEFMASWTPKTQPEDFDVLGQALGRFIDQLGVDQLANMIRLGVIEGMCGELGDEFATPLSINDQHSLEYRLIRYFQAKTQTGPYDPERLSCKYDRALVERFEKKSPSEQPWMLLYTYQSIHDFAEWSDSRREVESVKPWRARLVLDGNNHPAYHNDYKVSRYRIRRLALAAPAISAMSKLRDAFPHFEDVIQPLVEHLSLSMVGDGTFSLPPMLMVGPPGTGKTFFFQELAATVATTYQILNMESIAAGFAIVGSESQWGNSSPGIVFDTLLKEDATANPIILLDEIDKAPDSRQSPVASALLGLLETHSAKRFTDRSIPLQIDASRICWVATANDLSKVDLPLKSRFEVINVPTPDYHARRALATHIYKALRDKNHWGAWFDPQMSEEMLCEIATPDNAARDLRKNLTKALARAAHAHRKYIQPEDLLDNKSLHVVLHQSAKNEKKH